VKVINTKGFQSSISTATPFQHTSPICFRLKVLYLTHPQQATFSSSAARSLDPITPGCPTGYRRMTQRRTDSHKHQTTNHPDASFS
jgi:hypothetical protein